MLLFSNFFPSHVIAYTSDRTVDFVLQHGQSVLNDQQKSYLLTQLNFDLAEPVSIRQVHGNKVIIADGGSIQEADGILTKAHYLPLAIRSADCLPVFIYDKCQGGLGLIHIGWRGAQKNIISKAIKLMEKQWHSNPRDIQIGFGPAIHSCCYEVGKEFQEYFPKDLLLRDGNYYFDLSKFIHGQLTGLGVPADNISDCGICTCCDKNYFSNRRDGNIAGRMISLMVIND